MSPEAPAIIATSTRRSASAAEIGCGIGAPLYEVRTGVRSRLLSTPRRVAAERRLHSEGSAL
jgi:hypothetical protein